MTNIKMDYLKKMKVYIKISSINFLINLSFTFILILLLLGNYDTFIEFINLYFNKVLHFIQFDFGLSNGIGITKKIVFLNLSKLNTQIGVIPIVFDTFVKSIFSLLIVFLTSSILNYGLIIKKYKFINLITSFFNFLSIIHVIIFAIMINLIFISGGSSINIFLFYFIGGFSSNIFLNVFNEQSEHLKQLFKKDYILASRAWGDDERKYLIRPFVLKSLDIIISNWIPIITNILILEIIFQKGGIGSMIYDIYFASGNIGNITDNNMFIAILLFLTIIVTLIQVCKNLFSSFLIEVKR